MWAADERAYLTRLVADLHKTGDQQHHPRLVELATSVDALLEAAERGEITKNQLLEGYAQAEQAMTDPVDRRVQEQLDDLREAMRRSRIVER
jgi:hypothetical protein